jgi:hypothetical protein
MRVRTAAGVLACCCAALAACTAAAPGGPNASVTTPKVGRPPAPVSGQAALSSEAFTPYAALGISSNDGLAPGESQYTLTGPCMTAAGYPGVTVGDGIVPIQVAIGADLAFTQPWGGWGYLGATDAQQYGFRDPGGAALTALGLGGLPANPPSVPAAEQAAASKCGTIIDDFATATQGGPLAGIIAIGNDIGTDMQHDPAVTAATRAWSACMARNGYSSLGQPQNVFQQEFRAMYSGAHLISPSTQVSAAANQAQLAVAVTDADCTQATDLAGIYFAVEASYEQQLVNANQQALNAAVSQYRVAYARELSRLPALLRTTKAQPFGGRAQPSARHTG